MIEPMEGSAVTRTRYRLVLGYDSALCGLTAGILLFVLWHVVPEAYERWGPAPLMSYASDSSVYKSCPMNPLGTPNTVRDFHIPAMDSTSDALRCLEREAGFTSMIWPREFSSFPTRAVTGRMSGLDALTELVTSSPLEIVPPDDPNAHTIYLRAKNPAVEEDAEELR